MPSGQTTLLIAVPLLVLFGCAAAARQTAESPYVDPRTLQVGQILHLATGRLLAEPEALEYLGGFPVVYVGERHDSVEDHAVQLTVLRAMEARFPGQVALGLEMLQRPFQTDADRFVAGELSERDFQRVWQKSWGDFWAYRDILQFAREKRISLVALNASAATRKAVRERSADAGADLPEIDTGDRYHRAYIDAIFRGHGEGATDPDTFYRVQLLWDETMAETAAAYLKSPAGHGRRLVVFAGGNHVRYGFGIPRRVFRRVPLPFVIVEPYGGEAPAGASKERLMNVTTPAMPLPPADLYWVVRYRNAADDQVKLGILIEQHSTGVRVTGVLPDGPGRAAGLVTGDVIVTVDGVDVKDTADLVYEVGRHRRGDVGTLDVLRDGQRLRLAVRYDVVSQGK